MTFAVTPKGIGKAPGFRAIRDGEPLGPSETFTVDTFDPDVYVLAEDSVSLRVGTPNELNPQPTRDDLVDKVFNNPNPLDDIEQVVLAGFLEMLKILEDNGLPVPTRAQFRKAIRDRLPTPEQ